jgi:putative hemolysin
VTIFLELAAVAGLLLLNAFFVAAEYGLVTARRTKIVELQQEGNRRATHVLKIVSRPPRFIAAMQLGVTLTSLGIGALGEPVLSEILDPVLATFLAVAIAFIVITFLHVVIGELVPKGIALGYPERTALAVSAPVRGFFVLFAPLVWILQKATASVLHLLNLRLPGVETEAHSEAELKMLVRSSSDAGEIEQGEREMLYKVFDFADKEVHEVMVPRPEVVAIKADLPPEEALAALLESPFTRYPVYRESLDEIIGVVHVRDLFAALHDRGIEQVEIEQLLRPVYIVPETKDLGALLAEFRKQNQHMAVVVDEYGAMEGIVTLEDLLEEIVGEIEDEFDLPDESVERIDDAHIRIHGTFPIDDFNEEFGTEIEAEDYHTMAGIVFGAIGRAPEVGDTVTIDGLNLAVIEIEGSRIQRLEVEFQEKLPDPEGEEE